MEVRKSLQTEVHGLDYYYFHGSFGLEGVFKLGFTINYDKSNLCMDVVVYE